MLLTLVFLKFISERYHDRSEEIRKENADEPEFAELMITRQSSFGEKGVFILTEETDWEKLRLIEPKKLAVALDDATTKLMDMHSGLKNALPTGLFVNAGTEGNLIKQAMDENDKISHKKFKELDLIGRVYEYFLQAFAIKANDSTEEGEFYTPQSIVELIATFIEPFDGTLYYPYCGSGGMFVHCSKFVEQHGGNTLNINVYDQESDPTPYRLAKMNLAMVGITYKLGERFASTFTHDQHKGRTFRYIMANPPFEYSDEKCIDLAKKVKELVDESSLYADWLNNSKVRDKLANKITKLLWKNGYPPQWDGLVFDKVIEQAENFKTHTYDSELSQHLKKKRIPSDIYSLPNDLELLQAAEPVEVYGAKNVGLSIDKYEYPILIGCFKDEDHLNWILRENKYNIRMGNRIDSMDQFEPLFASFHTLVLYDFNNPNAKVRVFSLNNPCKVTGEELNALAYPDAKSENEYELFDISFEADGIEEYRDLVNTIITIPNHVEGAPVY